MALFCAMSVSCDLKSNLTTEENKQKRQTGRCNSLKFLLYVSMAFYILVNFYVEIFYSMHHCMIVYVHGRRLCSNRVRHGSTTISYPQCSLTFMRERYLHRCREQSFAIRAYAMSADIVSSHTVYCRIAYGITR